jgi:DNA polymerase-3 subunit delta
MPNTHHVFDFLDSLPEIDAIAVCALFGGERFLKTMAIKQLVAVSTSQNTDNDDSDFSVARLDGSEVDWADMMDELCTASLFGGNGPKLVIVDNADDFVKQHREKLEDFVANPRGNGTLALVVGTWAKNTRLYKAIDKSGLQVQCDAPTKPRGKTVDQAKVSKWIVSRAKKIHGFKLAAAGADLIVELTDCDFGRMEQELCKLALYAEDPKTEIKPDKVSEVVGGWRTRTMWNAIDAATEGNSAYSLQLLDQLLKSGEHPLALFGQLSWSLRRYGEVFDLVERVQRSGRKLDMNSVLKQAGFRSWGGELDSAGSRIKRLGRKRAGELNQKLLSADLALKRTHSREERGRLVLEELFVWLAAEKSQV